MKTMVRESTGVVKLKELYVCTNSVQHFLYYPIELNLYVMDIKRGDMSNVSVGILGIRESMGEMRV